LEARQREPEGVDTGLIRALEAAARGECATAGATGDANGAGGSGIRPVGSRPPVATDFGARRETVARTTVRVSLAALDALTATASELALTRNQLLEIAGRHGGSAFEAPLQRLSVVTAELQDAITHARM